MNSISFKGRYINSVNIKQNEGQNYKSVSSSFVELNPKDRNDISVLRELQKKWGGQYTYTIYDDALRSSYSTNSNSKYFALTTQKKDFHKLDNEKVLGIVDLAENKDVNFLNFIQVNPKYITKKPNSPLMNKILSFVSKNKTQVESPNEYKGIGSAILNSLKQISNKSLILMATGDEKEFFKKNGFKKESFLYPNHYIWLKK